MIVESEIILTPLEVLEFTEFQDDFLDIIDPLCDKLKFGGIENEE